MTCICHTNVAFASFAKKGGLDLEVQQRYLSYRTILVAIVSQNYLVLILMGYCIVQYLAKWVITQMCLCEAKCQGGYRTMLGEPLTSLQRYRAR